MECLKQRKKSYAFKWNAHSKKGSIRSNEVYRNSSVCTANKLMLVQRLSCNIISVDYTFTAKTKDVLRKLKDLEDNKLDTWDEILVYWRQTFFIREEQLFFWKISQFRIICQNMIVCL